MVFVVESGGIDKMSPGHSKLLSFRIHHFHEFIHTAADSPGNRHGRVIRGVYQKQVQQIFERNFVSDFKLTGLRVLTELKIRIRHGDLLREVCAALKCHESRHDLRQAGGIDFIVDSLCIEAGVILEIKQKRPFIIFGEAETSGSDFGFGTDNTLALRVIRCTLKGERRKLLGPVLGGEIIGLRCVKRRAPREDQMNQNSCQHKNHRDENCRNTMQETLPSASRIPAVFSVMPSFRFRIRRSPV